MLVATVGVVFLFAMLHRTRIAATTRSHAATCFFLIVRLRLRHALREPGACDRKRESEHKSRNHSLKSIHDYFSFGNMIADITLMS